MLYAFKPVLVDIEKKLSSKFQLKFKYSDHI